MSVTTARPAFGGRLHQPEFYANVSAIVAFLRPTETLRTIANHLNTAGFKTPSGLDWTRERVAVYIRCNKSN